MQDTLKNRTIFCHDNLEILENINSNSIDLIYLDPPFNKKKVFTAPTGSAASGASFSDIFREKDIKEDWLQTIKEDNERLYNFLSGVKNIDGKKSYNFCYLVYMAIRLMECHRILKETGSIYLHCDSTMSHYLKITLDCIFGESNFRNEIVWHYRTFQGKVSNYYPKKHDIIFWYLRDTRMQTSFNLEYLSNYRDTVDYKRWKKYYDENGNIHYGKHPMEDSRFKAYLVRWIKEKQREPNKGEIIYTCQGYVVDDVWLDVQAVDPKNKTERLGYPTQKPLSLLERIITASSNEGDVVLDPFCGCATTCIAAEKLNRKWIGIDVSIKAYEIVKERIQKEIKSDLFGKKDISFSTEPPVRTDDGKDYIPQKWVYVISNPSEKPYYKVGIAKDWRARLNSYQTADSDRAYKIEYKYLTTQFREIEKYIHCHFPSRHEWVNAQLKDIIKEIESYETKKIK